MKRRIWMVVLGAIMCLAWPLRAQFAYVANQADNTVSGYSIDRKTGALTPVPGSPFATGTFPSSVAVDPTAQFVYVTTSNTVSGYISGYSIDRKTGALTPVPGSPFATGTFPSSVAVDPPAQFAYVTTSNNTVSGYSIDRKTGALTPVPGSPFATGNGPVSVAVDPPAQFVYVTNALSSTVSGYSIDRKTGALTPVPGSPFATGSEPPFSVAVDPPAQFVYVTTGNTVSGYSIDRKTGALTPVPGSPFASGNNGLSVAVDPTAQFAYATGVTFKEMGTVSGYSIDRKTGALTPVPGSPFATGAVPFSVAVDPTAQFVYVATALQSPVPGTVWGYSIDRKTGALTPVPGSPFAAGSKPVSVAITRH